MKILTPITITDAMLVSSTVAEPAAGEVAWVSAASYTLGDLPIRTTTHRKYLCKITHTGRTQLPEDDPTYWEDAGPTLKWAPFDTYTSTAAKATTSLQYVMSPGFLDSVAFYALVGTELTVTIKNSPGGTVLSTQTISLYESAGGLFEYLFAPARPKDKVVVSGLPLHPTAELTCTLAGAGTVQVGMINIGTIRNIAGSLGGTEYGATAEPITYSRIKVDETSGETYIKRGNAATGMRATVVLPTVNANFALQTIQQVLDIPVSFIATNVPNYEGLNVFGLGSASLSYDTFSHARLNLTVKGMI